MPATHQPGTTLCPNFAQHFLSPAASFYFPVLGLPFFHLIATPAPQCEVALFFSFAGLVQPSLLFLWLCFALLGCLQKILTRKLETLFFSYYGSSPFLGCFSWGCALQNEGCAAVEPLWACELRLPLSLLVLKFLHASTGETFLFIFILVLMRFPIHRFLVSLFFVVVSDCVGISFLVVGKPPGLRRFFLISLLFLRVAWVLSLLICGDVECNPGPAPAGPSPPFFVPRFPCEWRRSLGSNVGE